MVIIPAHFVMSTFQTYINTKVISLGERKVKWPLASNQWKKQEISYYSCSRQDRCDEHYTGSGPEGDQD
jgi:hypothetical protein